MDRPTIEALLKAMLASQDRISDLLFLAGKPPLVEAEGVLKPFAIKTPDGLVTPRMIEAIADLIMEGDKRLLDDYKTTGSCDCSYVIDNLARFRVNIYKENRRRAIVMRKLQTTV